MRTVLIMFTVLAAVFADPPAAPDTSANPATIEHHKITISARPIPLDPVHPDMRKVGALTYAGGWVLSSPDDDFGGFSGLVLDDSARTLTAITDTGIWLTASFNVKDGKGPTDGVMTPYPAPAGNSKVKLDTESLIPWQGGYAVGIEQIHRVEWVAHVGAKPEPVPGIQQIEFSGLSANGGAEAIVALEDGKLVAFAENGLSSEGALQVWIAGEKTVEKAAFMPPKNFFPTDAARLPDGDILVLLRRFSPVEGVAAKILRIKAGDIRSGNSFVGTELVTLPATVNVDNMEGMDLVVLDDSTVRIAILSDDNFNPLQRTLLLMFDYRHK